MIPGLRQIFGGDALPLILRQGFQGGPAEFDALVALMLAGPELIGGVDLAGPELLGGVNAGSELFARPAIGPELFADIEDPSDSASG